MMSHAFSPTAGWITLAALLVFSPQLSGCDTSAPSQAQHQNSDDKGNADGDEKSAQAQLAPSSKVSSTSKKTTGIENNNKVAPVDNAESVEEKAEKPASKEPGIGSAPLVKRLVIASDVENREPVELKNGKINEAVLAFVELSNSEPTDSKVTVIFEHESGKKVGFIELSVPAKSPRYRTWGRTRAISEAGKWTAVISTTSGEELARQSFTVAG